jgi:hypothetical protein
MVSTPLKSLTDLENKKGITVRKYELSFPSDKTFAAVRPHYYCLDPIRGFMNYFFKQFKLETN